MLPGGTAERLGGSPLYRVREDLDSLPHPEEDDAAQPGEDGTLHS